MPMFYSVYVLLSLKDKMFYTGYSKQLLIRMEQHDSGLCLSTRNRLPVKLIYYDNCLNRTDAIARERYLKSGMGKRYIRNRLKTSLIELL